MHTYPLFNSTPYELTAIVGEGGGHLYKAIPALRYPQCSCSSFSGMPVLLPLYSLIVEHQSLNFENSDRSSSSDSYI